MNINDRKHVEISPQRGVLMQTMCKHISKFGGIALIGDYGHWGEKEDTFRVYLSNITIVIKRQINILYRRAFVNIKLLIHYLIQEILILLRMLILKN